MPPHDLAEHLRYLESLGVTGLSRDPAWRSRPVPNSAPPLSDGDAVESGPEDVAAVPAIVEAAIPSMAIAEGIARHPWETVQPGTASLFNTPKAETPVPLVTDPASALAAIRADIGDCTRCKLHRLGRTQVVFGVGDPKARLMFVGEAPGQDEDIQGFPFVGRAGQLLTKIIEAIGLTRDQVYIANVIKCRPPGNRNPEPDEVATCEPFLFRQIDVIAPTVIVALGKFAAQGLLRSKDPISKLRGPVYKYRGADLVVTFHPAFLLRSPGYKRETWEDMKKVRAILNASS